MLGTSTTHSHQAHSLHPPSASPSAAVHLPHSLSLSAPNDEDEPYTIKCICIFNDDDGNTVLCEKCDTWQHINCYYSSSTGVPDVHNCVDCEPRPVDRKRANDRQRQMREQTAIADRKPKRPAAKSHKKKAKEPPTLTNGHQVNGWPTADRAEVNGDGRANSPRDHQPPPAKRPKTNHRNSSSTSSNLNTKSPSLHPTDQKRNAYTSHPSPPNAVNGFHCDMYSPSFLGLAKHDPGEKNMQANSFSTIGVVNSLSSWILDSEECKRATSGRSNVEVFQRYPEPIETLPKAGLSKRTKESLPDLKGNRPLCNYVVAEANILADGVIEELKGSIGCLDEYRQDPNSRFQALQHSEPFVFVHPQLPIFIDTRQEGSLARYIRRSCRPNAMLKTIVTTEYESHFYFCALRDIEEGQEVTMTWNYNETFREYLTSGNNQNDTNGAISEAQLENWVSNLLANYGGCACESPQCPLAMWDRRAMPDSAASLTNGTKPKRRRKQKHPSPQSTGKAINSRSGSEGALDEDDDRRSASGSVPSKPLSRDVTPAMVDSNGVEISDREKRKLAAIEHKFRQIEDKDPHKKKKRPSGGSTSASRQQTAAAAASPAVGSRPQYVNAGTSSRMSGSPVDSHQMDFTASPTKALSRQTSFPLPRPPRPNYVDSSTQTDSPPPTLSSPRPSPSPSTASSSPSPARRKPFIPLTKRLLLKCHEEKMQFEESRKRKASEELAVSSSPTVLMNPVPKKVALEVNGLPAPAPPPPPPPQQPDLPPQDTPMEDASAPPPTSSSLDLRPVDGNARKLPPSSTDTFISPLKPPPPPSWPSSTTITNHTLSTSKPNGYRSVDLRVQLPPTPHFSPTTNSTPSTPASALTSTPAAGASPLSSTTPVPQSPLTVSSSAAPPQFSPSVVASVVSQGQGQGQSPMKKKLSLSDYMSKRKGGDASSTSAGAATSAAPVAVGEKEKDAMVVAPLKTPTTSTTASALKKDEDVVKPEPPAGEASVIMTAAAAAAAVPITTKMELDPLPTTMTAEPTTEINGGPMSGVAMEKEAKAVTS